MSASASSKKRAKRSPTPSKPQSLQLEKIPSLLLGNNQKVKLGTLNTLLFLTHSQDYMLCPLSEQNESGFSLSPVPVNIISALLRLLQHALPTFSIPGLPAPITPETYSNAVANAFCDIPATPYDRLPSCPVAISVLTIFRNLSFVPANRRHLAYHSQLVVTLTTFVQDEHPEMSLLMQSLVTLRNISAHLDVAGRRMLEDRYFTLPPSSTTHNSALDGFAPDIIARCPPNLPISKNLILPFATKYISAVLGLFATLNEIATMELNVIVRDSLSLCLSTLEEVS